MKEWSYTSTPPLGPFGLLQGETLPYLTLPSLLSTSPISHFGHLNFPFKILYAFLTSPFV